MSHSYQLQGLLLLGLATLFSSPSWGSVVITGTRQIYAAKQKEITIKLNNDGSVPALVQSWVDSGDVASNPSTAKAPFVLTPPLARIDPGKGHALRLMFTGAPLPSSTESVFWLNVLEIPPKSKEVEASTLQMAFRSRIKIFYRPEGLAGNPTDAIAQVKWRLVAIDNDKGYALEAFNPSAYHVSIASLSLVVGERRTAANEGMVAPGETKQFPLAALEAHPGTGAEVEFAAINDYGAHVSTRHPLHTPAKPAVR